MIKDIENKNESIKINDKEILALKEHFPSCFKKDGSLDIVKLTEQLKDKVDIVHEGYELKFLGKSYAKLLASIDTTTIIKPDAEHNDKPENKNSENIYISGDNLDGLKHLLKSYAKQVKCIYIDPPYNTGSDGFVYKDNFNFTSEELQRKLSIDPTQADRIIDLTKRKSASHSAWLLFMYSRLQLARDLLTNDGVIFISIDDNEQSNLKLLCDDIFGEENFVAQLVWHNSSRQSDQISIEHEYVLAYGKTLNVYNNQWNRSRETADRLNQLMNKQRLEGKTILEVQKNIAFEIDCLLEEDIHKNTRDNLWLTNYKNIDENWNIYYAVDLSGEGSGPARMFGDKLVPAPTGRHWMGQDYINELIADGRMVWRGDRAYRKLYIEESLDNLKGIIRIPTRNGSEMLKQLMGKDVFDKPKPHNFINHIIRFVLDFDSIVLDFFAGSGTTAHSVMELNSKDGGKRKFITIQLPENLQNKYDLAPVSDKPKIKKVIDFLTSINRPTTLDQIGMERIIRAAKKIKTETNAEIDYGFKHFELCEVNPNTLDKCESFDKANLIADTTILNDFGTASVLTTWLVNDGYGFNAEVKALNLKGYTAYYCNKHLYLINPNFTQESVMKLFEKYDEPDFNPINIVLFGYSFNEWAVTEMLENNLRVLNDSEKNLKINIDVRY